MYKIDYFRMSAYKRVSYLWRLNWVAWVNIGRVIFTSINPATIFNASLTWFLYSSWLWLNFLCQTDLSFLWHRTSSFSSSVPGYSYFNSLCHSSLLVYSKTFKASIKMLFLLGYLSSGYLIPVPTANYKTPDNSHLLLVPKSQPWTLHTWLLDIFLLEGP